MNNLLSIVVSFFVLFSISIEASGEPVEPRLILPGSIPEYIKIEGHEGQLKFNELSIGVKNTLRRQYEDSVNLIEKDGVYSIRYRGNLHKEEIQFVTEQTPISVPLFVYEDPGFEGETIYFTADIRGRNLDKPGYLEMLCTFPDGNTYFSRGLSESLAGTGTWEKQGVPFYLKAGQRPIQITVGVRFEGRGDIELRNIKLSAASGDGMASLHFYQSIMPRLLGIIYGIWGAAIGIIGGTAIPKGRFKRLVLSLLVGMFVFSVLIGTLGYLLQTQTPIMSEAVRQYYIAAGLGALLSAIFIPVTLNRYRQVELRKMEARDLADSGS